MSKAALLVGIDHYAGAPLSGCVSDAKRVCEHLSKNDDESPNFACRTVVSEVNSPDPITKGALKKHVKELFEKKVDVALFFFAGHGTADNLGGYLVTQDASAYDEGLAMNDVLNLANASPASEKIIVLDCCQSGVFGQVPAKSNGVELSPGVVVLAACRDNEYALEINGTGGLFTTLFCAALAGGAADVVGKVTVASAYAYADEVLDVWNQRPLFKAHVEQLVPLRTCNPTVPPEVLRMLPTLFPTQDHEYPLSPAHEPTAEPRDDAREAIFAKLQKLRAARLVVPVGHEHMYYAAMESKGCRLTPLGRFYWQRVNSGKI